MEHEWSLFAFYMMLCLYNICISILAKKLTKWLLSNLDTLYLDRYNRHFNSIIAVHLFPTFNENHQMWKVMQYLNKIEISVDMTLNEYLNNLSTIVPLELELEMNRLKELLGC